MRIILSILFCFSSVFCICNNLPKHIQELIQGKKAAEQMFLLDSIAGDLRDSNYELSMQLSKKVVQMAQQNKLQYAKVKAYISVVKGYRYKGFYDTALIYMDSVKTFVLKNNIPEKYPNVYDIEGLVYVRMAEYEKAAIAYYTGVTSKRRERHDNNKLTTKKQEKVNHFDK